MGRLRPAHPYDIMPLMDQQLSYPAVVFLLIAAVAICVGTVVQVRQYRRGDNIISRGQFIGRLVMSLLLLSIIGLIFFGSAYRWPDALTELIFWSGLMVLGFVVVFLALHDFRLIDRERHVRQAEIYRSIQKLQDDASEREDE